MSRLGPVEMKILVWAGLLHKYPKLKQEEASDIIDEYMEDHTIEDLSNIVMDAIQNASVFGRPDKGENPPEAEMTETPNSSTKISTT